MNTMGGEMEWEFEDLMDREEIFVNGISNHPCHRESHGTVMNFYRMKKFLNRVKNEYSLEEWKILIDYFKSISYLSPMNGLTARMIESTIFPEEEK